ncbi:hypothetical protein, partial [Pseudomonas sp. MWU13-3659]|uniref:hypothetical protein n=1 Tax=Pseudomonas sp. MWU13-3659 TaxID=2986964 RepID=UPI00207519EA
TITFNNLQAQHIHLDACRRKNHPKVAQLFAQWWQKVAQLAVGLAAQALHQCIHTLIHIRVHNFLRS